MNKLNLVITPMEYAIRIPDENPVFGESVIKVRLQDQGAGMYLEIQCNNPDVQSNTVSLEIDYLRMVLQAAELLLKGAEKSEESEESEEKVVEPERFFNFNSERLSE